MGTIYSNIFDLDKKVMKIVMVGLDAAGKTTILYKLKQGEMVTTVSTMGECYDYSLMV